MALRKKIATQMGIDAEVWDIVHSDIDHVNKIYALTIFGWVDEEAMNEKKQNLDKREMQFRYDIYPYLSQVFDKITESKLDENGAETNEFFGATRI
jgi:hypothetical protein